MRKKIGFSLGIVVIGSLLWYFFVKPHDYVVRFKTKASPGTVNQTLKFWIGQQKGAKFIAQKSLSNFDHRINFNDSTFFYNWKVVPENDSISIVKAYVTDSTHSLKNRLLIPFSETDFEKRTKNTVRDAMNLLLDHLETFKVTVEGEVEMPAKYCACVPLKSTQLRKVNGMMDYYSSLSNFMARNEIELDGRPMVEVENWNMGNDSIAYNFCFPIMKQDSLPQREGLIYKQIPSRKALRAIYNGNYLTSDRAWYGLLDYAKKNNIEVERKPLEVFHTNPNMGGNELDWKAEIFMPIKE